jgi:arylsulfatase A
MIRSLFASFLLLGAAAHAAEEPADKATKKPNIICILADDLGYGDVACLNPQGKIATPNLDRLAASGISFSDAHTGSAVCTPTRYGILTGRYCWRTRLASGVLGGDSPHLIDAAQPTVASLLRQQGYATEMIGKWHLGWDFTFTGEGKKKEIDFKGAVKNGPDLNGFDHYFGFCGSLDMGPYVYVKDGQITAAPDRVTEGHGHKHHAPAFWRKGPTGADFQHIEVLPSLIQRACDSIQAYAKEGKPFFLYLPLPAPHTPIIPTPEFAGKSQVNPYADFVIQLDNHVGKILQVVKNAGIEGETLILFTSDNGCSPMADFPALAAKGHDPSAGLRGTKADLFEGGHHVPFLFTWPGHIKPGSRSSQIVCLNDFVATAVDAAGGELPAEAAGDSLSLLPVLTGTQGDKPVHEAIVHHSINGSFAIRQGPWKLLLCPGSGGWTAPTPGSKQAQGLPPVQLYNLAEDPAEKNNLQAQFPGKVKELRSLLQSYVERGRSTPGPELKNDRKIAIDKMAAAGLEKPDEFFTPEADKGGLEKVAADPSLPSVLILGDSISIGYTPRVRKALQGQANVLRPDANCGDTGMALKSLDQWLGETRWSVIHFNWGLWDVCYRDPQSREQGHRDKVKGKISTSLEDYEKNLETLVQRLEKTGAVLIWGSTTVVPEGEVGRVVGDELKYNEVAARVMKKHGIRTDDLHALTKGFAPELFVKPGDVHYQGAGYDKLAAQVAAQITAALPEKKAADNR